MRYVPIAAGVNQSEITYRLKCAQLAMVHVISIINKVMLPAPLAISISIQMKENTLHAMEKS